MHVLIIKTSSMGDIIQTLPALTDAQHAIENISFDWVVEEGFSEIPHWHPSVRTVIPSGLRRWRTRPVYHELKNFMRLLRQVHYDYVIDSQGLLKSAILTYLARGLRCGYARGFSRGRWISWAYDQTFEISLDLHAVVRNRSLFSAALNYAYDGLPDYHVKLKTNPNPIPHFQKDYLVFIPNTSRDVKLWPEKHWSQLLKLIAPHNLRVLMPWHNERELKRVQRIKGDHQNADILPHLNLNQLAQIILGARAVVSVDTGLLHLASALNIPTVSLYGPTDVRLNGSTGLHQIHLTAVELEHLLPEQVCIALNELLI
jgi:heptosyltransferase I